MGGDYREQGDGKGEIWAAGDPHERIVAHPAGDGDLIHKKEMPGTIGIFITPGIARRGLCGGGRGGARQRNCGCELARFFKFVNLAVKAMNTRAQAFFNGTPSHLQPFFSVALMSLLDGTLLDNLVQDGWTSMGLWHPAIPSGAAVTSFNNLKPDNAFIQARAGTTPPDRDQELKFLVHLKFVSLVVVTALWLGCSLPKPSTVHLGTLNVWGFPNAPAFWVTIDSNRTLSVHRYQGNSDVSFSKVLEPSHYEELLALWNSACRQNRLGGSDPRLVDGVNLQIQIREGSVMVSTPKLRATSLKTAETTTKSLAGKINELVPEANRIY